jgi:hypothetical protein
MSVPIYPQLICPFLYLRTYRSIAISGGTSRPICPDRYVHFITMDILVWTYQSTDQVAGTGFMLCPFRFVHFTLSPPPFYPIPQRYPKKLNHKRLKIFKHGIQMKMTNTSFYLFFHLINQVNICSLIFRVN